MVGLRSRAPSPHGEPGLMRSPRRVFADTVSAVFAVMKGDAVHRSSTIPTHGIVQVDRPDPASHFEF
jgi:hypothetical protein